MCHFFLIKAYVLNLHSFFFLFKNNGGKVVPYDCDSEFAIQLLRPEFRPVSEEAMRRSFAADLTKGEIFKTDFLRDSYVHGRIYLIDSYR